VGNKHARSRSTNLHAPLSVEHAEAPKDVLKPGSHWSFKTMRARVMVAVLMVVIAVASVGAVAVGIQVNNAAGLLNVRILYGKLYSPTDDLVTSLQEERRLSMQYLGSHRAVGSTALANQQVTSSRAESRFRRLAAGADVQGAADETLRTHIAKAMSALTALEAVRPAIEAGKVNLTKAAAPFNQVIQAQLAVLGAMPATQEPTVSNEQRSLYALQQSREALCQETAVVTGAIASGPVSTSQQEDVRRLAGAWQWLSSQTAQGLTTSQRASYDKLTAAPSFTRLRDVQDKITAPGATQQPAPDSASGWAEVATRITTAQRGLEKTVAADMLEHSDAAADAIYDQTWETVGGMLLFVVLFGGFWLFLAPHHVLSELKKLRGAALHFTNELYPQVTDRLRRGETVDISEAAAPMEFGPDEFGDVGRAFNNAQVAAAQGAIDQHRLTQRLREIVVTLAQRNQRHLQQQLKTLKETQDRSEDSDQLERLFTADSLAVRMRRAEENLLILAGMSPGKRYREPVPMLDLVRSATGEVEFYQRVKIHPMPQVSLHGHVAGDIARVLAELIDNATQFSPPHTGVGVEGAWLSDGFVVEVEDRGLGIDKTEELAGHNERLGKPPELTEIDVKQLGLVVVAALAARHGLTVRLRSNSYGGLTATILIPASLVVAPTTVESRMPQTPPPPQPQPWAQPTSVGIAAPIGPVMRMSPNTGRESQ
jgi:signal transduction histidine kinase